MNKKSYIAYAIMLAACFHASLNAMHPLVKKQLQEKKSKNIVHMAENPLFCDQKICDKMTMRTNLIIPCSEDIINDNEELNRLLGDEYFNVRKSIIEKMISDGMHPNDIKYQIDLNPLYEAVRYKDKQFGRFLLQHGATPDEKTRKTVSAKFLTSIIKQKLS